MYENLMNFKKNGESINYLELKMSFSEKNSEYKKLEQEREQYKQQQKVIIKLIYTFKGIDQVILRKKYIEGMTLERIAFELKYSHNYIKRRHSDLRRTINVLEEWVK